MTLDHAPLVTVYITNHNYGDFIKRSVESVLAQTMTDYELIIIDDGSSDHSREIIERYADHPQITPIFQQNKGLTVTNNIAIRAARGKYIVRLDADDWLDEHMLEILSNVLERNPDVGMVFPDYYHVDAKGNVIEQVQRHDFDDVTLQDQPAHGACTMIRHDCLLELGGYDETIRCQDGYDLWIRFIEQFKVRNVNLPLFFYRQHGSSLTKNEERILATRGEILQRHAKRKNQQCNTTAIIALRGPEFDPLSPALKKLAGQPLVNWTIHSALNASRIKHVVLTTPDHAVIESVKKDYGEQVQCILRDPKLAMLNTYIEDTIFDALGQLGTSTNAQDAIMRLSIESPFRGPRIIDAAIDVMELFDADSVIGVRPETDFMYRHNGAGLIPPQPAESLRLEREELYREVGGLWLTSLERFKETKSITSGRIAHVVVDQRSSFRIRSQTDWQIAEIHAADATNQDSTLKGLA